MLPRISVVLVHTRFPENIGMVARAMANMGVSELVLVQPERWDIEKALPLATGQGERLLHEARVVEKLEEALASCNAAFATTARTGGLRREMLTPEKAACEARGIVRERGRIALVFGPEDRGLTNAEIDLCTHLVTVPTAVESSSLNLAQAVLIILYECVKADMALPFSEDAKGAAGGKNAPSRRWAMPLQSAESRRATLAEERLLFKTLQETLHSLAYLPEDNPAWFMQPLRRFLRKSRLRRHEFDMLMGVCRQIGRKIGHNEGGRLTEGTYEKE